MCQNSTHQAKPISFYESVHVSFINLFTKNTVLGNVSYYFHKKVLVFLGDALTIAWYYIQQVHKLSWKSVMAKTYLKTVSGN